jgi:sugar/nucleoside kinase (ribokinase family)
MCTFLGASVEFTDDDVEPATSRRQDRLPRGYLFDAEAARRAFAKAAAWRTAPGRMIALTLSDGFVVERHRAGLLGFIETQVDLLFANEAELCASSRPTTSTPRSRAAPHVKLAAVTRSEQGSVILARASAHVAAEPVEKVVDTTGAGDQYAAGFMFGLSRGGRCSTAAGWRRWRRPR